MAKRGWGVGVGLLALSGVAACSGVFGGVDDCKETRTCIPKTRVGEGGAAGDADGAAAGAPNGGGGEATASGGQAGEPGSALLARQCTADDDCDDHLACNGQESCSESGYCQAGVPLTCANSDAAHCTTECVEGDEDGQYICIWAAEDADGDGHGTTACRLRPGDDCDDARETVFFGAPELCDGLDNDCDEKLDVADGLEFSGAAKLVGQDLDASVTGELARIVWSDVAQLYGLFWRQHDSSMLAFAAYDAAGARKLGPTIVANALTSHLVIAGGGPGFGVAWSSDEGGDHTVELRTIDEQGKLGKQVSIGGRGAGTGVALAYSPGWKRWVVAADHGLASVDDNGATAGFARVYDRALAISGSEVVVAADGLVVALSATKGGTADPRIYRYEENLTGQRPVAFDNPDGASRVQLAADGKGGFAVVAQPLGQKPTISLFDPTAAIACKQTLSEQFTTLAGGATGYTLLGRNADWTLAFSDLGLDCALVPRVSKAFASAAANHQLSASPTTFGALWSGDGGDSYSYSIFDARYCH